MAQDFSPDRDEANFESAHSEGTPDFFDCEPVPNVGYVEQDPTRILAHMYDTVRDDQIDVNRRMASRAAGIADAFAYARTHPWIYVHVDHLDSDGVRADAESVDFAERAAVLEASLRLQMSESTLRNLAHTADMARAELPELWSQARKGFAMLTQVETAVKHLPRFAGRADLAAQFDDYLADQVLTSSPALFRSKAKRFAQQLAPGSDPVAHAEAFQQRRVILEDVADGMSWIHAFVSTPDAHAIKRRLTSTAKHVTRAPHAHGSRDERTRDQVRADLFVSWLRGVGTPTAVKTKVFVTVPLTLLTPEAQASVRRSGAGAERGLDVASAPLVLGSGEIDDDSARQLLLEAGRFTRVITDPVSGVILDMDRRSRLVTRAQREWLMLTHHLCVRDGCNRAAIDAEIDHWREYHGPERGSTDIANLHPLCGSDHRLKGKTKLKYRRRRNGSVAVESPTGFSTRRPRVAYPDDPPF